jgi:Zn-dependent protease with chaperone function
MDFFEAQARAKKHTSRLVVLFGIAVLGTIAAGYFTAVLLLSQLPREGYPADEIGGMPATWWNPRILGAVVVGTLVIVGFSSLFKWLSFRTGGSAVAESVGGRRIEPGRATPAEHQLLNVVEEMAIASGVPMPAVYVLDQETGINAFAAGLTTSDAVVAVTRGTLEKLNRDELQGVIGHEFSHILNGDMGLNVKLTALLFGILVIGLMGRGVLWSLRGMRVRSGNNKNSGGIVVAILGVGLAMMIIGYIGYFFGRLIQAAVSRQREYLADASAVQFTRNPRGITGALSKIGGFALGSRVNTNKATAIGHFFFAQGFKSSFGGAWATHPPLEQRIRAIDPQWDGRFFDPPEVVDVSQESFQTKGFAQAPGTSYAVPPQIDPQRRIAFQPAAVVADIGLLTDDYYRQAQDILATIPDTLRHAARQNESAPAVVYGLLISDDAQDAEQQTTLVKSSDGAKAVAMLTKLLPDIRNLDPRARLPLLLLSTPALRQLDNASTERFLGTLDELVHADAKVSTFEFVLQKLLTHHLELAQNPTRTPAFFSFNPLAGDIAVLLSVLAWAGAGDIPSVTRAYAAGSAQLKSIEPALLSAGVTKPDFATLDQSLERLAQASLPIKKRVLLAAGHVIGNDGTITVEEGELYRALAAAIGCPLPPLTAAA